MKKDLHQMRPYGDHPDDGRIQLSFTFPVPPGPEAKEAAKIYLEKLGLKSVQVVTMEPMGEEFSFFVAYGSAVPTLDFTKIQVPRPEFPILPREELTQLAQERLGRRIVVVGATTGSDAHTVGIDAILSIKGLAGDKGLEAYPIFQVVNLRAQVENRHLVTKALEFKADAILVSKMVTQQDQHLEDLKELARFLREERRFPPHLVKIAGGPRIDHLTAKRIGFDAGFGPGTKPSEVANFIVHTLIRRLGDAQGENRMDRPPPRPAHPKGRPLFGWFGRGGKNP